MTWKQRLSDKFPNSGLVQMLVYNFWFRLIFLLLILFALGVALALPKIWTVTPPSVEPAIQVSVLDMAQAWSLRRTARRATAAGDYPTALYSWRASIANHPANLESCRGLLDHLTEHGDRAETLGIAWSQCNWLLNLTQTNRNEVTRVAEVYDAYELAPLVLQLLEPHESELSPREQILFLKSLFETGDISRFGDFWNTIGDEARNDEEIQYYRLAYLAGWGDPSESGEALAELKRLSGATDKREVLIRLMLTVANKRQDTGFFREVLDQLVSLGADRPIHHLLYWKLLKDEGRGAEAIALARAYTFPPESAENLLQFANTYVELGLKDEAMDILTSHIPQFGFSEAVWLRQASLLAEQKQWQELISLARHMRTDERLKGNLDGFIFYLEGRAELELQHFTTAQASFREIPKHEFRDPSLTLHVAVNMIRIGYPDIARDVLLQKEADLRENAAFWQVLHATAALLKDQDLASRASEVLFKMQSENWVVRFNYAASLLARRQDPEHAVTLTMQLLAERPQFLAPRINHALALLQNFRSDEAKSLLESIPEAELNPEYAASYYLAWFECHLQQHEPERAREVLPRIAREHLFATEREWLEAEAEKLEKP